MILKIAMITTTLACLFAVSAESPAAENHGEHSGALMNYHRIDERLVTGGHVVDDGLSELKAEGVVCDFRQPNVIRAAPVPFYNTFHDVWTFAQVLARHDQTG